MTSNTTPIFTNGPQSPVGSTISAANTAMDGTGTVVTIYTAGAVNAGNPSMPLGIKFRALGTNVATVARIFINNGSTNATPANNILFDEMNLAATTASNTAAQPDYRYQFPDGFRLPSGYKINIALGTAVAAGYALAPYGADY